MLLGTLLIGRTLKRLYGIRPQTALQAQLHKFQSKHAVSRRVPTDESADPELLTRPLRLQPSGRVVRNRLMKAPLTEYLSTYDAEDVRESGLPTQRLLNLYTKFGRAEMIDLLDAMGFDFVELTGGSGEKLAPSAVRASTAAREAFFDDFLSVVRPHFKKTAVFLTGGYRTVAGMTEAIRAGKTDGISLGRSVAAEPDLPRKILEFGFKANSQLGQASRTAIESNGEETETADICAGISDFSDPTESERYEREFTAFLQAGGFTPATFSGYFDYAPPC
ncbi:Oxidoreductase, FAD/FMN-binding protein [Aphelenchoides fujianensis]|nr:Oxidoreductase, FAD/FMN-binding protein [Aphelenchoides fujianensis]